MKNKVSLLITLLLSVFWLSSCEDNTLATLNSTVPANELSETSKSAYVLTTEEAANEFENLQWTVPDYGFAASVAYTVQIDKVEGDFTTGIDVVTVNLSTHASVKVNEINTKLLALGLTPDEASDIQIRVVSVVGGSIAPVISNIRTVSVTPYATSFPPIYMIGDAVAGWSLDKAVEVLSPSYNVFSTVTKFNSGGAFRFFSEADWNKTKWNWNDFVGGTVDANLVIQDGSSDFNFQFTGTSGYYRITVNGKLKTITLEPVSEPMLFMVGAAVGGWDQAKAVKMTFIKEGVFEATTAFSVETFRFFAQNDWGPTSYNYPYFTTVDAKFENGNDDDKNLKFIDTPGSYKITVDLINKTVTVGDTPKPKLYMTGDGLNGWNWDAGVPVELTYISAGIYEATATFTSGGAFRFFAQADWNPTSYNYPYFTTVDANFVNASDDDSNLKFVGTTGPITINVNLTTKVVSVK